MEVLEAWEKIVGSENLFTQKEITEAAATATFATQQRVLAIIRPSDRLQVQECVKIANQYHTPIYPISGGKNWGLGSRVPPQDHSVIIDLGRLNQIVDYNEKLAYITVEPGVTFRQVYEYLQAVKSNLFVSVIGGSPEASVIGNTLERGDGFGPYGDRFAYVCGLEVVLPTGECIHTGFSRFTNTKTTHVARWGVGPYLDGIFTQSNLGIVTQMTVWLLPIPTYYQTFSCTIEENAGLEALLDRVQTLILQGTIRDTCLSIWNCYKVIAKQGRFPWKITQGKTPLSLKELKGTEPWFANGSLFASSEAEGLAQRQIVTAVLDDQVQQLVFSETEQETQGFGAPHDENTRSTYWRKQTPIPTDINPDRDSCGVIWLCPLFPFDGKQIVEALEMIISTIKLYQFEPNLGMVCISGRSIRMFVAIMYDRQVAGEDEKAIACHDRLLELLLQAGYIPDRLGIQSMNALPSGNDDYGEFMRHLKQHLDPQNILAPGRYDCF
ncbi:MAG: FAD-binding oxidoreductase [Goleter apudmare HA4340-LM2]|jgi:4-cresol dehydrogenase (hydroxylating)|nr:FAD-binding oxidoreductase [Goleter apudmare HA4340-LM2]